MRRFYVMCALLILLAGGSEKSHAMLERMNSPEFMTIMVVTGPFMFTTMSPWITTQKLKEYAGHESAKDDAMLYIATDGHQRGVHLDSAIEQLRASGDYDAYSDIQLTQAILISNVPQSTGAALHEAEPG